jgi:diadenosine tetraphosphate (Ap4A) HIT family hydrolase
MNPKTCLSCAVVHGFRETLGGTILETSSFHAHQDVAYPIPGLVILAAKRHITALDQLTPAEAAEFVATAQRIRAAQRRVLAIEHVYFFYNEDTTHHFHLWMVPRHKWMKTFGRSVESLRPVLVHARDHMNSPRELAATISSVEALRNAFANSGATET